MGDADDDNDDWWVYTGQGYKDVPKDVKRVRIGREVERIRVHAFCRHGLETLDFSEAKALRVIEAFAFEECESLRGTLRFPPHLQEIQAGAFYVCQEIEKIDLADAKALKTIGNQVFRHCPSLKTAVLPASIIYFGDSVFEDCLNLELVRILGDNFSLALRIAAHSPPTGNNGSLPKEDCRSTNNLVALFHLQPIQPEDLAKRHNEELNSLKKREWDDEDIDDLVRPLQSKEIQKLQEIKAKHDQLSRDEVNKLVTSYRRLQAQIVTGVQHSKSDKADGDDKFGLKASGSLRCCCTFWFGHWLLPFFGP